jgi:hypothetical protein
MNPDITAFTESVAAKPPESYYDAAKKEYLVLDAGNDWLSINETQFKRVLKKHGISCSTEAGEYVSPLDAAIVDIQNTRNVKFAGPLAGYRRGLHTIGSTRVLVTSSPRLIEPVPGEWPTLKALLSGLLQHEDQLNHCYGWLKVAVHCLRKGERQPGQVLVLVGPHRGGKSLVQNLLTEVLGGRSAKPFQFMTGATSFNADLFGAEHLIIEDESPSTDIRARRAFGAQIKQITVCDTQRMHAKHRDAIVLQPFWRMSVSLNDEPENVLVLPPIDESLADKVMLFRTFRQEMPMPTATLPERKAFWAKLIAELPAFVAFLETWTIPASLVSPRFGVSHYHHPEILALLDETAPELRLLALIDQALFAPSAFVATSTTPVEMTALQVEQALTSSHVCGAEAKKLLTWNSACGTYLGRLSAKLPERVRAHRTDSARLWCISPPPPPADHRTPKKEA